MLKGQEPIDERVIQIPFGMYASDAYPMIVPSYELKPIFVEIYEVDLDLLSKLDLFEAPYNFHRERIFVSELNDDVEIYIYDEKEPPDEFRAVQDGNWLGGNL